VKVTIADLIQREGHWLGGVRPRMFIIEKPSLYIPEHMLEKVKRIKLTRVAAMREAIKRRFPVENFTLIGPWVKT
jgi:hypothetical protein